LVPGDGDTYFLPRLVGAAKALELLWTADFIEAPEAHRLGIVQRVAPDAQLKETTYALARQIADGPQIPIRMIKRLVYQSLRLDLRTHLDLVSSHMSIVRQTADHKEGVAAFKEQRPPRFERGGHHEDVGSQHVRKDVLQDHAAPRGAEGLHRFDVGVLLHRHGGGPDHARDARDDGNRDGDHDVLNRRTQNRCDGQGEDELG